MLIGLVCLPVLRIESFLGGAAFGVLLAVAAGGWYVGGHVASAFFPVCAFAGVGAALLMALMSRRPLLGFAAGALVLFAVTQAIFSLSQMSALGEPSAMSPEYVQIMHLDKEGDRT